MATDARDRSNGSCPTRGTGGGSCGRDQGGHRDSHTTRPEPLFWDLTSFNNPSNIFFLDEDASTSKAPPIRSGSNPPLSKLIESPCQTFPNPSSDDLSPIHAPFGSLSPIIRTAVLSPPPHVPGTANSSHQMTVDRVSSALEMDPVGEDSDDNDSLSEDKGLDISDDNDLDDLMNLDQYHEEARCDALIRKGFHAGTPSQKKGRLDVDGLSSSFFSSFPLWISLREFSYLFSFWLWI